MFLVVSESVWDSEESCDNLSTEELSETDLGTGFFFCFLAFF